MPSEENCLFMPDVGRGKHRYASLDMSKKAQYECASPAIHWNSRNISKPCNCTPVYLRREESELPGRDPAPKRNRVSVTVICLIQAIQHISLKANEWMRSKSARLLSRQGFTESKKSHDRWTVTIADAGEPCSYLDSHTDPRSASL